MPNARGDLLTVTLHFPVVTATRIRRHFQLRPTEAIRPDTFGEIFLRLAKQGFVIESAIDPIRPDCIWLHIRKDRKYYTRSVQIMAIEQFTAGADRRMAIELELLANNFAQSPKDMP